MSIVLIRTVLWTIALCALVTASAVDVRRRIIPNQASAAVAATGFALCLIERPGTAWISLPIAATLVVALGSLSHFGLMGGGDVKLIAAVSLLVPPQGLGALLLEIALAGGVLSLAYIGLRRVLGARPRPGPDGVRAGPLGRLLRAERTRILTSRSVPYGLAILAGVLVHVLSELP